MSNKAEDLFHTPLDQSQIDFENEGGETYICGNPPYSGLSSQSGDQKSDSENLFNDHNKYWKSFDYVMGWFWKAREYMRAQPCSAAFVSTNSICQGQLVPMFWPTILSSKVHISFAHLSFRWSNLATNNAGVTVVIIGISNNIKQPKKIFQSASDSQTTETEVNNISAYLAASKDIYVEARSKPPKDRPTMIYGNKPTDGGNLIMSVDEARRIANPENPLSTLLAPILWL